MSEATSIEIPQMAIEAEQFGDNMLIFLVVTASGCQYKAFICTAEQNFQAIAKQLHDNIVRAGQEARRAQSGLVVVRDLPDGLKGKDFNGGPVR